jgi:hypothetical protein
MEDNHMNETTAPPPGPASGGTTRYDDTLALNDIHAVLTSPTLAEGAGNALQAIAEILTRTGRSPYPSRIITATIEDGPHGVPAACIDAEGTIVTVGQDSGGPGIRIDVTPRDPADDAALVIAVGDRVIHRARPTGLRPVPHRDGGRS